MTSKLFSCIREYKKNVILTPVLVSLEVVMEAIIPYVMAILIDKGIDAGNIKMIYLTGLILIILAVLSLLFGYLSGKNAAIGSVGFAKNLRHDMYHNVQNFSFASIDKFSTSSIITRLTTDVINVQNAFQILTRNAVRAPLMMIFSLIMAFSINKRVSLIFLLVAPVLGIGLFFITKAVRPTFEKVFKTYDELNNKVQENIRGIRVVKSFVQEDYETEKFKKTSGLIYNLFVKAEKSLSYISPLMQFCMYTSILLISWFSARLIVSGNMTTGELTSLITYASSILSSLMMLSMTYVMITISIPSIKRCSEILNEKSDIENKDNKIMEVKNGSIIFKNVDFSYSTNKKKLSLKNINLDIKSSETIGIIGSTGSSKTTLINLIPRLYDTTNGEVIVSGHNVKDYDIKTLRDNVSVVLQKNVLFSGTIKENLKWGNENATDEEIEHACFLACATEFIFKFENKYDTYIDRGGANVSGGQKQRLCIARALLKNPKILILDDSTSSCDTKTDALIKASLKKYLPECTKIIIAQRISSIEDADRVIVMNNGKIDDFDTPKNLLKTNKIYKEIYNSQKNGGIN